MIFSAIGSIVSSIASGISGLSTAAGTAAGAAGSAVQAVGGASSLSGITGAIGTAASVAGQIMQYSGARRAEAIRQRQMDLEAARARTQQVRQAVVSRAQVLNQGEAQGAAGSSGVLGGASQAVAQGASNIQAINQGQALGREMFSVQRRISSGQTLSSIGGGIQQLGSFFNRNYEQNRRGFGFS